MTQAEIEADVRFEPPGPGSWKLDAVHFPRPVTRYWAETHPEPFRRGVRRLHALLRDADRHARHGIRERLRVHDRCAPSAPEEVPARFQRAEEVFAGKLWREQLREWDEDVKPASIAAHRELQAVDPDALVRRGARRLPDALPRPPRGDDRPAHALHGRGDDPDRGLPRPRRSLDRPAGPPSCSA